MSKDTVDFERNKPDGKLFRGQAVEQSSHSDPDPSASIAVKRSLVLWHCMKDWCKALDILTDEPTDSCTRGVS